MRVVCKNDRLRRGAELALEVLQLASPDTLRAAESVIDVISDSASPRTFSGKKFIHVPPGMAQEDADIIVRDLVAVLLQAADEAGAGSGRLRVTAGHFVGEVGSGRVKS